MPETLISEFYVIGILTIIAFWQKKLFKENAKFSHWQWNIIFSVSLLPVWFFTKNPVVIVAAILIREIYFSPFLNLIRGHTFWYVNLTDPNGSELDKLEKGISKPLYFLSLAALICLQFIFFK